MSPPQCRAQSSPAADASLVTSFLPLSHLSLCLSGLECHRVLLRHKSWPTMKSHSLFPFLGDKCLCCEHGSDQGQRFFSGSQVTEILESMGGRTWHQDNILPAAGQLPLREAMTGALSKCMVHFSVIQYCVSQRMWSGDLEADPTATREGARL